MNVLLLPLLFLFFFFFGADACCNSWIQMKKVVFPIQVPVIGAWICNYFGCDCYVCDEYFLAPHFYCNCYYCQPEQLKKIWHELDFDQANGLDKAGCNEETCARKCIPQMLMSASTHHADRKQKTQLVFERFDANADGQISWEEAFEEFARRNSTAGAMPTMENMRAEFAKADRNGDGFIQPGEFDKELKA